MDPADEPTFRALMQQAKRVCAKHPALLPPYLAAIREKGRGIREEALKSILDEVRAATPKSS